MQNKRGNASALNLVNRQGMSTPRSGIMEVAEQEETTRRMIGEYYGMGVMEARAMNNQSSLPDIRNKNNTRSAGPKTLAPASSLSELKQMRK